jgi:hypothetical protein
MRITAVRALEAGIAINAIVHDAFLIEASDDDIDQTVETMCGIMMQATEDLVGRPIPVDRYIVRHPHPYHDEDGEADFNLLMRMLEDIEQSRKVA